MAILHLILQWRHARDLLKSRAKRFRVGVTHLVHHFVDVFTGGLQSHFRGFYFDALNVFHHSVRRRLFEPALQVPSSERKHGCQLVDSDLFLEVLLNEFLCFENRFVLVVLLTFEYDEGRLAVTVDIDLEDFRAGDGQITTGILFDQIQDQVEVRECSSTGVQSILVGNNFFYNQLHIGVHAPEFVRKHPMRGTLPSVQQPGGCEQKRADTKAGNLCAVLILLYNPGHILPVPFHGKAQVSVNSWYYDKVRPLNVTDQTVRLDAIQAVIQTRIWRYSDELHIEYRIARLRGQEIIHTPEQLTRTFDISEEGAFRHKDRDMFHILLDYLFC